MLSQQLQFNMAGYSKRSNRRKGGMRGYRSYRRTRRTRDGEMLYQPGRYNALIHPNDIRLPRSPVTFIRKLLKDEEQVVNITYNSGGVTGPAAQLTYTGALAWKPEQFAGWSDFSNIFDRFKFRKLYLEVVWSFGSDTYLEDHRIEHAIKTQGPNDSHAPQFSWFRDYNDNNSQTGDEMRQHTQLKTTRLTPGVPHVIEVHPACASAVYRPALAFAYSAEWGKYLSTGAGDIPFYGMKWMVESPNYTLGQVRISARAVFDFLDRK